MATLFTDIYDLNEVIKLDSRLIGKPKNLIYQLYYSYLKYAITYFADDCYKNLNDNISFSQTEYSYVGDGIKKEFVLDSIPPSNSLFYVSINNIENTSYTYDVINNKIIVNQIPLLNDEIYISAYIIGQFNVDLNMTEQVILSEGMIVPWLKQQKNKNELLNQMVYGRDFSIFSQSAHIKEMNNSIDNQYYHFVMAKINEYSWKQNPDGLMGLGGGLL